MTTERARRPELPKRFYKEATVAPTAEGFQILLDERPLRTPAKRPLVVPLVDSAELIAEEWRVQGEVIDPATMPATRLANTTIDGISDNPWTVREEATRFIETDLLFYRAEGPEGLVAAQREAWDPVLDWARERLGAQFALALGVIPIDQPPGALEAFRRATEAFEDPFDVAAFYQMTALTGSALLAFAVMDGHLGVDDAWERSHVDEDWNISQWGEDAEAAERRRVRREEMHIAAALAGLA